MTEDTKHTANQSGEIVFPKDPKMLDPLDVKKMLDEKKGAKFIDIRPREEHEMLHIEGFELATRDLVEEIFNKWPKDTDIVLCDHTGSQVLMAIESLESKGLKNAKGIDGGIDAWSKTVDPLLPRY